MDSNKPTNLNANDFFRFDIRAGTITKIEEVPKSKKLLKLEISFGPELGTRTILAGVASAYPERCQVGQHVMAVLNLEPRQMMGIDSHGMILASEDESGNIHLASPGMVPNGSEVG